MVRAEAIAEQRDLELRKLLRDVTERELADKRVREQVPPIGRRQLQVVVALAHGMGASDEFRLHGLASQGFYSCAAELTLCKA